MEGCYLTHRPLADMHGDGVYFNRELLRRAKQLNAKGAFSAEKPEVIKTAPKGE